MANLPKTTIGEIGKGVVAGAGNTVKQKPKGGGKAAAVPALRPNYNLVFDPTGQWSNILSAEDKARRDLYLLKTGTALSDAEDHPSALEGAGLIHGAPGGARGAGAAAGGLAGLSRPTKPNPVYASAMDALDALGSANAAAGKAIDRRVERFKEVLAKDVSASDKAIRSAESAVWNAPLPGSKFKTLGEGVTNAGKDVVKVIAGVGKGVEAVGDVSAPIPTGVSFSIKPSVPRASSVSLETTPVSVQDIADKAAGAAGKIVSGFPSPYQAPPVGGIYGGPAATPKIRTLGDTAESIKQGMARPNLIINLSSPDKTLPPSTPENATPAAKLVQDGQGSDAANAYLRQQGYNIEQASSVFDQNAIDYLQRLSDANGWPKMDQAFKGLTPGEMLFQAYTKNDPIGIAYRNTIVSLASGMAVPAAVIGAGKEVYKGSKTGDWKGAQDMLVTALEPIRGFNKVLERDGPQAAIKWALTNYPVDSVYLAKGAWNAVGRTAGVAARLAGSEYAAAHVPVTVPGGTLTRVEHVPIEPPVPRVTGKVLPTKAALDAIAKDKADQAAYEASVASAVKEGRVNDKGVPYTEVQTPIGGPAQIGVTSPNLWRTFVMRSVKTRLASISPPRSAERLAEKTIAYKVRLAIADSSLRYRSRLERKASERDIRLGLNIKQGIDIQIQEEFMRILGRRATNAEHQRAVFELTWPKEFASGKRLTPDDVVAYFDDNLRKIDEGGFPKLRGEDRAQQIIRWETAAREWQKIADTTLAPEIVSKLRKLGRGYGRKNAQYVADALGVSVGEAKRADYLRVLVIDPDFMVAATEKGIARAEALGRAGGDLNVLHENIVRKSAELAARTTRKGYGKSGGAAKRLGKFEVRRDELAAMLSRASDLARQTGDESLAAEYAAIRDMLVSSREQAARGSSAPAEAAAPQAAPETSSALDRLRAQREATLAETTTVRGKPLKKPPTSRAIGLAEQAVQDARAKLTEVQDRKLRSESAIAREEANVAKAETRLEQLQKARQAHDAVVAAEEEARAEAKAARANAAGGKFVLDTNTVDIAMNASERAATIVFKKRPGKLSAEDLQIEIDRAMNEDLDAYIARLEAADKEAVLHLVQRPNFVYQDPRPQYGGSRAVTDTFFNPGRLIASKGTLFAQGGEDTARMFWNLMEDTSEFISSENMGKRMNDLIEITGVPIRFTESQQQAAIKIAEEMVANDPSLTMDKAMVAAAEEAIRASSEFSNEIRYRYSTEEWKIVNAKSPRARKPTERTNVPTGTPQEDIATLLMREIDDRSIDPNAPGEYYLIPRGVYRGIQKALEDEAFSLAIPSGGALKKAVAGWDRVMRAWRTMTLNILPKTVFNNFAGSVILAIQAGAGPRDFYYAWRAMHPKVGQRRMPLPPELQQRFFQQETSLMGTKTWWGSDSTPYLWAAAHMNNMRFFNGFSEDFARLAVWYSKAAPYAKQEAARLGGAAAPIAVIARMRGLNNEAIDLLDAMARRDPQWRTLHESFLQHSFDFLGDLHKGGPVWAYMRLAIPFAQWYWHMLKLTFFTMPLKYPGRALMLQRLADIGDEYQRTHGVVIPWGASLIPLFEDVQLTPQGKQWVTSVIDSSPWYPQATSLGGFTREGSVNPIGFTQGTVAPLPTSIGLLGLSILSLVSGGAALTTSETSFIKAAKDEYGIEITAKNWPAIRAYIANQIFTQTPLSPFIMSMQGRAATAYPGNAVDRQKNYPTLPPDRVDVATLFSAVYDSFASPQKATWNASQYASMLSQIIVKGLTGIQVRHVAGMGPMEAARLQRLFVQLDKQFKQDFQDQQAREQARIAAAMYDAQNGTSTFDSTP